MRKLSSLILFILITVAILWLFNRCSPKYLKPKTSLNHEKDLSIFTPRFTSPESV